MDTLLLRFENLKKKNPLKAIHLIKRAIIENPDKIEYLEALGTHLCGAKDDKEGLKYLRRADKIADLRPNTIFLFALALMRTSEFHLAIKQFKKINTIYPEAYYNSALCYLRLNRANDAISEVRHLLEGRILGKEAYRLLIDIYSFSNDTVQVKLELENYKNRFGEDGYYRFYIANDCYRKKNYIEAAYHYSKIDDDQIKQHQYFEEYAYSLSSIKQYNKALKVYQEVIYAGYAQERVIFEYVDVLFQLNKYQEVIDILDEFKPMIINKVNLNNLKSKAIYKLNLE